MLKIAIAHSSDIDTSDAIEEILEQCREQLSDLIPHAGILFAAVDHEHDLILKKINETFPEIELIGCTTYGELSSLEGYAEDSISLILFSSDELEFKGGVANNVSEDSLNKIKKAADITKEQLKDEPKLCITTPSGLTISGSDVLDGLTQVMGDNFPIFGAKSGDQWTFTGTKQFFKNNVYSDSVPFLFISGPLSFSFGIETGWNPVSEIGKVTKSDDNVVFEIDGQPAVEFYRSYLGETDLNLMFEYPLAVFTENKEGFYLRASIETNHQTGSLSFFGDVPEGATVQITRSTRDNIIEAAKLSVDTAIENYPGNKPEVALCFSCGARKNLLGTRIVEEYKTLKNHFPELPIIGFYGYGEFSPIKTGNKTRFHNCSFVCLLLGIK